MSTLDEEFLAHIVVDDEGHTAGEMVLSQVASRRVEALLLPLTGRDR